MRESVKGKWQNRLYALPCKVKRGRKGISMPEAILSPAEWEAIKAASIRGVSDQQLADEFGIEKNAIHQRRFRDEIWKSAIQAKTEAIRECKQSPETASLAKKVASTISESSQALSDSNLLLASQIAKKGLLRASGEIDHLPIENMADIERIFKMAALAGKWNQPQISVNQAFAFGGGQDDADVVNIETEIVEDAGSYGDAF